MEVVSGHMAADSIPRCNLGNGSAAVAGRSACGNRAVAGGAFNGHGAVERLAMLAAAPVKLREGDLQREKRRLIYFHTV